MAVHECGHAITAAALDCGVVQRVLLTTTGGETHRRLATREGTLSDLQAELSYLLAGRVAERLLLTEISAGSGGDTTSDLSLATTLAVSMETRLGLGANGLMWDDVSNAVALRDPTIRTRVRQHLTEAEAKALAILTSQVDLLREMSRSLLHNRELSGAKLTEWLTQVAPHDNATDERAPAALATATGPSTAKATNVGVNDGAGGSCCDPQVIADHMM